MRVSSDSSSSSERVHLPFLFFSSSRSFVFPLASAKANLTVGKPSIFLLACSSKFMRCFVSETRNLTFFGADFLNLYSRSRNESLLNLTITDCLPFFTGPILWHLYKLEIERVGVNVVVFSHMIGCKRSDFVYKLHRRFPIYLGEMPSMTRHLRLEYCSMCRFVCLAPCSHCAIFGLMIQGRLLCFRVFYSF